MAEVRIDRREDFEKALRQFKIQTKREGVLEEYQRRQYYSKPSKKGRRDVREKR